MELRNSSLTEVTKGGYPLRGITCARVKVSNENYEQIQAANRKIRRNTRCMHECCLSNLLNNAVSSTYRHCPRWPGLPRLPRLPVHRSHSIAASTLVAAILAEGTGIVSGQTGKPSRSERHDGILLGLRDAALTNSRQCNLFHVVKDLRNLLPRLAEAVGFHGM
jgi:hypothetical protein